MTDHNKFMEMRTPFDCFVRGYLETAVTMADDEIGTNWDASDINPEMSLAIQERLRVFWDAHKSHILSEHAPFEYVDGWSLDKMKASQAGYDLWHSAGGSGVGFWENEWVNAGGDELQAAAKAFGNVDLYIGDDGQVWA